MPYILCQLFHLFLMARMPFSHQGENVKEIVKACLYTCLKYAQLHVFLIYHLFLTSLNVFERNFH